MLRIGNHSGLDHERSGINVAGMRKIPQILTGLFLALILTATSSAQLSSFDSDNQAADRAREEARRAQEQADRAREEMRRQQAEAERVQQEMRRQQEEAERRRIQAEQERHRAEMQLRQQEAQEVRRNAYGAGVNADQYGRPHTYRTADGQDLGIQSDGVKRNGYGAGVHTDKFGRPVYDSAP